MEEAERLCDRVAIMDHGEIMTLDKPERMIEEHFKESAIQFSMKQKPEEKDLAGLPAVTRLAVNDEDITLYTDNVPMTIASLLDLTSSMPEQPSDLFVRQASLEDVFLKLTGKRIRE